MQQYKTGDRIGGEFTVLKIFGGENRSGMGVVYLVQHREIPKPVVLKTFQQTASEEVKSRFASEAHAWVSAGAHTNIVQAYWVREISGQVFVAAEYIEPDEEGRNSLTHFLSAGQLRPEIILWWATQFCQGMSYARSKGVLAHRDIKPDNLMIDRATTLKVTDFGLAKSVDLQDHNQQQGWRFFRRKPPTRSISKTMTGSAMGTLSYMAPEQFIDMKGVDHRADIYSFGVILYQMAAGNRYPYQIRKDAADVVTEYHRAHTEQQPIPFESPLMPCITRCLEKQTNRRYATYDELLSDLNAVARRLEIKLPKAAHVAKVDEGLYAQAQSYVTLGDKDRAMRAIDDYVSKYPENECGWTEKGRIHLERGEGAQAIVATRQSLNVNPYNTHAWNNLGLALRRTEAPIAEIREAYTKALHFDPHNTSAMINLALAFLLHKKYAEAAAPLVNALKLQPDKASILQIAEELCRELLNEKEIEAAETLLSGWTAARPTDTTAWHNLGLISLHNGDPDRAIQCFTKVHDLSPQDNFAVTQLAKLYFQMKKGRECLDYCNKLLQRGHEPLLAVSFKARILNFIGGYELALKFLQPYLDQNPENDVLWVVLAEIHEYCENYDSAIKALQTAKRLLERGLGEHSVENLQGVNQKLKQLSTMTR